MPRIPMIKGYNLQSALRIQAPSVSLITEKPVVSGKEVVGMMRRFVENETEYRAFKNLNARASSSGLRLNMRFPQEAKGKIAIDVADKSFLTNREFVDLVANIFEDKAKNIAKNTKAVFSALANAFSSNKKGGVKTVIIDPSERYTKKISDAIEDVIVDRELAKY